MSLEHRTLTGQVRAARAPRTITARAITPGVVDDYGTVWKPDAFDQSLAKRLPVLAWSHDWTDPIGRGTAWNPSTAGPVITFRLDNFDAVPRARQAWEQTRSGTLTDVSVGFSHAVKRPPTDDETRAHPGVREVIERAQLDEVSLVLAGAVPGAEILATRSRPRRVAVPVTETEILDALNTVDARRW